MLHCYIQPTPKPGAYLFKNFLLLAKLNPVIKQLSRILFTYCIFDIKCDFYQQTSACQMSERFIIKSNKKENLLTYTLHIHYMSS